MNKKQNFEKYKQQLINKNNQTFQEELSQKYDQDILQASSLKITGMSKKDMQKINELTQSINNTLKEAYKQGDPASDIAQEVCTLHQKWLCMFWPQGLYSKQAHLQLVESYLEDERFISYYDKIAQGCTQFLYEAMKIYCK